MSLLLSIGSIGQCNECVKFEFIVNLVKLGWIAVGPTCISKDN